jgi:hypothetical protein
MNNNGGYVVGAIGSTNFGHYPTGSNGGVDPNFDVIYDESGGVIGTAGKLISTQNKNISYKYGEDTYIQEISDYIDKTYGQHYSKNQFQATEFIIDSGHGTGFCIGNVLKYAQRYGRKGTRDEWRKDLMKVIHYAMMQLHVHDNEGSK